MRGVVHRVGVCVGLFAVVAAASVTRAETLTLTGGTLESGTQNQAYGPAWVNTASGGTEPYTYTIAGGTFPPGLSIHTPTGEIWGTPTGSGTYTFTVEVDDATMAYATAEFTITVAEAGEGEGGGVSVLSGLNWVPFSASLPAWWYVTARTQNLSTPFDGGIANEDLQANAYNSPIPGADGSVGAGDAGRPGLENASIVNYNAVIKGGSTTVGAALFGVPEVDGCGYRYFRFIVVYRSPGTVEGTYTHYATLYQVVHGRNGYVGWNGAGSGYSGATQWWNTVTGSWQPVFAFSDPGKNWTVKFPAQRVLQSILENENGVMQWGAPPLSIMYPLSRQVGSAEQTKIVAALNDLYAAVSAKIDMTGKIPRCASQDIESAAGGGAAAVDHVDDAAAAGPTAIDSDGDGVPDYRDIDPQNSSVIGPPPAAGVSYANYWTRWSFSGMGLDTMNDTTYTSFVIPFKKPTLAGNVDWLTYTVDTDPTHSTTGAGTAVNTLRATCRLLGVALVAFWTVHGVLITIRQW